MLDKGIIERIVLDYKDIYKQALEDNIQSPAELPYFEGDFSSAYEDIHGERIDIEYLIVLQSEGLPYYGKGGAPHDSRSHWAAWSPESVCEPFHGPRD